MTGMIDESHHLGVDADRRPLDLRGRLRRFCGWGWRRLLRRGGVAPGDQERTEGDRETNLL